MRTTAFAALAVYTPSFKPSLFLECLRTHPFANALPSLTIKVFITQAHSVLQPRPAPIPIQSVSIGSAANDVRDSRFLPLCGRATGPSSHAMDRKQEGSRVQSACHQCIESNSPCNGQKPCQRCGHYSLSCDYLSRARPACLECNRNVSECDGETPCQRCRQRSLQCVYTTQVERSAVAASLPEEAWPQQTSFGSRLGETETRSTAASARLGTSQVALGAGDMRYDTREPDSYFIKEHNKGIDEDHLAKFKPNKDDWKLDRIV